MQQLLSWVGSKWKDRFKIEDFMQNSGPFSRFVEPFCGSASMFFHLNPRRGWINDVNEELIEFYRTLRNGGSKPIMFHLIKHHVEEQMGRISYSQFQKLKKEWEPKDEYERAAKFFLLNRCSYYGKLESFGGINYEDFSEEKLTHMYSTKLACARLNEGGWILEGSEITCVDFEEVLCNIREDDFIFLDPPYDSKEMFGNNKACYGVEFVKEHLKLAKCLEKCKAKWLMTINESDHIRSLYKDWAFIYEVVWQHKRNRSKDEMKKEFYITNYDAGWFAEVYKTG